MPLECCRTVKKLCKRKSNTLNIPITWRSTVYNRSINSNSVNSPINSNLAQPAAPVPNNAFGQSYVGSYSTNMPLSSAVPSHQQANVSRYQAEAMHLIYMILTKQVTRARNWSVSMESIKIHRCLRALLAKLTTMIFAKKCWIPQLLWSWNSRRHGAFLARQWVLFFGSLR